MNAKMYILREVSEFLETTAYTLRFLNNTAEYGGALFVADGTNSGTCASESYRIHSATNECFLQTLRVSTIQNKPKDCCLQNIYFRENNAGVSGQVLYGGLLDRCTVSPFGEIITDITTFPDGFQYLKVFSNISQFDTLISSDPVRVCFCQNRHPDCEYQPSPIQVRKGEAFNLTLVAVDQGNNTIDNTTIHTTTGGGLGEGQQIQRTRDGCTNLTFNVLSQSDNETLKIYAEGPCKDAKLSKRVVSIEFSPCSCPIGFQPKKETENQCECMCDSKLIPYTKDCNPQNETLRREGNVWISFIKSSTNDYLVYPHCPLDYCKPSSSSVFINLNLPNGADAQCTDHRTGILCGMCEFGFSLSLGSSNCIQCPSYWPAMFVVLTLAAVVSGMLLVTFILLLDLTVAIGSLNGVIFYVNIVWANKSIFLPKATSNFAYVFVAWLNLEAGFDVCLYQGMTAYWKTLLQLIFPTYVISLVIMVVVISDHSSRFTKLIGKRHPVPTLATLILLSYAKLLHSVITILSYAALNYPGDSGPQKRLLWQPDASVRYLNGGHIVLFLIAIAILIVSVVYTLILFSWQWLLCLSEMKLFKWVRYQKLSLFVETYLIPYTPKNRYWTGLLLISRIVLYVAAAANVSGDPKVNLLSIGIVIGSILLLKEIIGIRYRLYRQWLIEVIEIICHFNLMIFCIATFFTLEDENAKASVANISISITFLLFLGILLYHIYSELIIKVLKCLKILPQVQRCHLERSHGSTGPGVSYSGNSSEDLSISLIERNSTSQKIELREALLEHCESVPTY